MGFGASRASKRATLLIWTAPSAPVAAYGAAEILCTDTSRFNKGDVIHVTADRDGSTGVGMFQLVLSYENEGR